MCNLPAKNWVESVGYIVVSIFNYFFAQCYFYIWVTLREQNRWYVMSPWGASLSHFLGQTQVSLHSHSQTDEKVAVVGGPACLRQGLNTVSVLVAHSQPLAVWGEAVAGRSDGANLLQGHICKMRRMNQTSKPFKLLDKGPLGQSSTEYIVLIEYLSPNEITGAPKERI